MSITYRAIVDDCFVIIIDGKDSCKNFKEMIQRGTNLWPDAQPEIKELADQVTNNNWISDAKPHGNMKLKSGTLQDYNAQAPDKISKFTKGL